MSLKALKIESAGSDWKSTAIVISVWVVWLSFVRHLDLPPWMSLPMTVVVLLYGSVLWSILEGSLILLVLSWIHHSFSITPPGLYWLSVMIVFLGLRFATTQLSFKGPFYTLSLLILGSLVLDLSQLYFISRTTEYLGLSWFVFLQIFMSALIQGFLGLFVSGWLMERGQIR